uniref:Cysteine-rich DPF motif domain-containing protein 1 n=1 Tax=Palpitomonas bilix TaxID=652834 RepID=A0A7S3D3U6_9EUKA|mmetsp:Transcript_2080/g.4261  ORF Transcript_2080/g.4261 Transcript_2080/m.4261 type:complete len:111 (+) Transcript_2080:158-490(+)
MSGQKFTCSICMQDYPFEYFGKKPPFQNDVVYVEDVYVLRDPFHSLHSKGERVVCMGGRCSLCLSPVCASSSCSLFYTKRFCSTCARKEVEEFPKELEKEIMRMKEMDAK